MVALIKRLRESGNDRGAEMVEFALITPLLLLVIAGIADFGFLFQSFEVSTNAARKAPALRFSPATTSTTIQRPRRVWMTIWLLPISTAAIRPTSWRKRLIWAAGSL